MKRILVISVMFAEIFYIKLFSQTLTYEQELQGPPTMGCCIGPVDPSSDYEIVFEDDFNGNALDASKWITSRPDGSRCYWTVSSMPNAEAVYFGDQGENVFVENGLLKLKADTLIPGVVCGNKIANYGVGQVWSQNQWRYGIFECKFKLPFGAALYPSFWMQANNGDGYDEIDIMEAFGNPNNLNPVGYSNGFLNSTSGQNGADHEVYGQAINPTNISTILYETWNIAQLEWTPYELIIRINGIETVHTYRYYKKCNDVYTPITCQTSMEHQCNGQGTFVENMSFPDDKMKISFWLNFQPYAQWSSTGQTIAETETELPAFVEIDYFKILQLPSGTWGDCEDTPFCTYSIKGHKEDTIQVCSDGTVFTPKDFDIYPWQWEDPIITTSSNMNAFFDYEGLHIEAPSVVDGYGWVAIAVAENADPTCIGQDRIVKRIFDFNEMGAEGEILIDGDPVQAYKEYAILEGFHSIDLDQPISSNITSYTISIGNNIATNEALNYNLVDLYRKRVNVTVTYNEGCTRDFYFYLEAICGTEEFSFYLDNDPIGSFPLTDYFLTPCFGNHTVRLDPQNSDYYIYQVTLNSNGTFTNVPFQNNAFELAASNHLNKYIVRLKTSSGWAGSCDYTIELSSFGHCCLPGQNCEGYCHTNVYPNPTDDDLTVYPNEEAFLDNGTSYTPIIHEINIYSLDNELVQHIITSGSQDTYTINTTELHNNTFYILETKDQYNKTCHSNFLISR